MGSDGSHPGLGGELGEEVPAVKGQRLQIELQLGLLVIGLSAAKTLKIVDVQGDGGIAVPAVAALAPEDQVMAGGGPETV